MSVPLDRLYHYLGDCVNHDLVIYRWAPHGSRKLEDLTQLTNYPEYQWYNNPIAIFHDQEPLDYDFYTQDQVQNQVNQQHSKWSVDRTFNDAALEYISQQHLRAVTDCANQYDLTILVHSEQCSWQVDHYSNKGFVPVYYWSHAVIAQDWFRYAEHDPKLQLDPVKIQKDFLIYNRAWAGTREYRLCFAEQLVQNHLYDNCKMSFNSCDGGYYGQHQFVNPEFQITNFNLDNFFPGNTHPSSSSADYCVEDYATTGIEIVLETLFDDHRWHLTEKSLRPIACGKPFILMATSGSLQYLRQYGFKTFDGLIDETYDSISNPKQRLQAVIAEMKRISVLPVQQKTKLFMDLDSIAKFNKHLFFTGFFDGLVKEYTQNMDSAMIEMARHRLGHNCAVITQLMQ